MKMIIEGVMESNLSWGLVFIGVCIAVVVEIIGIPVIPFAIGIYLPVQLNACVMAGGLVRLVGILLAVFAIFGLDKLINLSQYMKLSAAVSNVGSLVVFALIILSLLKFSVWKKKK